MRRTPDLNDIADILVVDDTPENLQLLSEMLRQCRHELTEVIKKVVNHARIPPTPRSKR